MKLIFVFLVVIGIFLLTNADELPIVDQPFPIPSLESRNGRLQNQKEPNHNCTILEAQLKCPRSEIRLPHAFDCTRFYECDDKVLIEKQCADRKRTRYDPFHKICEWNHIVKCINYGDYNDIMHGYHNIVTSSHCGKH